MPEGYIITPYDGAEINELLNQVKTLQGSANFTQSLLEYFAEHDTTVLNAAKAFTNGQLTQALLDAHGYTDDQIATLRTLMMQYLNQKADKSTTLEGYGITDAYSKTQADGRFVKNGQSQININDGDIILDTENSDGDLFVKNQSGMAADVHAKDFEASGGHKLSNKNNKPIVLTQAEYDALVTKDPNQDYYIPED